MDIQRAHAFVTSGGLSGLSEATPAVLMALLFATPDDSRCDLSVRDLARLSGRSKTSVVKALRELEDAGVITTTTASSVRRSYVVTWAGVPASGTVVPAGGTVVPASGTVVPASGTVVPASGTPLAPAYPQTESIPPYISPQGGNDLPPKPARKPRAPFIKPDPHDVAAFFKANGSSGPEAGRFWNHYESNGWRVGKNPMANWEAAARNWMTGRFIDAGKPEPHPAVAMAGPTTDQVEAWKAAAEARRASQETPPQ